MGSDDPVTTDAANVYLKTREHRRTLVLEKRNNKKHTSFQMGEEVCIWRVPKGEKQSGPRWSGSWIGPETTLARKRRVDGRLGRLVWCVHNVTFYRAAPKHIRHAPFTRSIQQFRGQVSADKCFNKNKFLRVSGQTCWVKKIHLRKLWRLLQQTTWMTKVLKDKFQQSL